MRQSFATIPTSDPCVDTLALSPRERQALLAELRRRTDRDAPADLRNDARMPFELPAGLVVRIDHPGGSSGHYLVRPRNLSTGGVGFLHGGFIHGGSICSVQLPDRHDEWRTLTGRVQWCRHLTGRVHEVGVVFDQPIRLERFIDGCVRADPHDSRSVPLPRLAGRLLYATHTAGGPMRIAFHLGQLGLQVTEVRNGLEALQALNGAAYDLIVIEYTLPGMNGVELSAAIRNGGYTGPIVLLARQHGAVRRHALAAGCNDVQAAPHSFHELVALLTAHLPRASAEDDEQSLFSDHWPDQPMRPVVAAFIRRLEKTLTDLVRRMDLNTADPAVRLMCLDLACQADGYGFDPIRQQARSLYWRLAAGDCGPSLSHEIESLQQLCRAAQRAMNTEGSTLTTG